MGELRASQRASTLDAASSLSVVTLEKKASVSKLQGVVAQVTARALQEGRVAKETAVTLGAKLGAKELELGKLYERLQVAPRATLAVYHANHTSPD